MLCKGDLVRYTTKVQWAGVLRMNILLRYVVYWPRDGGPSISKARCMSGCRWRTILACCSCKKGMSVGGVGEGLSRMTVSLEVRCNRVAMSDTTDRSVPGQLAYAEDGSSTEVR